MCVLTSEAIKLRSKEIFKNDSYCEESVQEASYDLRIATDSYMRVGGVTYSPDKKPYKESGIVIEPVELAMLPTIESFNMPCDLVGSLKIKFNQSRKGLTPLFGPKVDPYFGKCHDDERLFLWVSNLGPKPIEFKEGECVFNVQFHTIHGDPPPFKKKEAIGPRVAAEAHNFGPEPYLGFMDAMRLEVTNDLNDRLSKVEHGTTQVIWFGIFLIASALFAGAITVLFSLSSRLSEDQIDLLKQLLSSDLMVWTSRISAVALTIYVLFLAISAIIFFWKTIPWGKR